MKELVTEFEVGVDALNAVLGYVYSGRVGLPPGEPIKCADEDCRHRCCKPAVDFELGVLITSSKFEISELVSLYQVGAFCLLMFCLIMTFRIGFLFQDCFFKDGFLFFVVIGYVLLDFGGKGVSFFGILLIGLLWFHMHFNFLHGWFIFRDLA